MGHRRDLQHAKDLWKGFHLFAVLKIQHPFCHEREWHEELQSKFEIYHWFMRTNVQNMRERKVCIVISGSCKHASEEVYNLWLDARSTITTGRR